MALELTFPATGFSVADLADIIDFIAVDAEVTETSVTATSFSGTGIFGGGAGSFSITGTGFAPGVIGGSTYIVAGLIDTITFTSGGRTVTFEQVGDDPIDMSVFAPIIYADDTETSPLGIENYLLGKDWIMTLGDADDVAPEGTLVGDGAPLNLRGNDIIRGNGGNDVLFSGDGRDKLFGNGGGDTLSGGNGNDKLFGGAGKDVLDGGKGNDKLVGGGGVDRFVFHDNSGRDKIVGFNALKNREDVDLSDVSEITSYRDLSRHHMEQVGADVVIDDHAGTRITLLDVNIDDLGKGDFLF